jgi:hypothetical protein
LAEPGPARRPLRALLDALDPRRRRQLKWLTVLTLANAAADLLFVASAMLFLAALASGGGPALPASLRDWLGPAAGDVSFAALAFGAGAVAGNSVRLLYLWLSERTIAGITHELTVEVQRRVFAQPYAYHVRITAAPWSPRSKRSRRSPSTCFTSGSRAWPPSPPASPSSACWSASIRPRR